MHFNTAMQHIIRAPYRASAAFINYGEKSKIQQGEVTQNDTQSWFYLLCVLGIECATQNNVKSSKMHTHACVFKGWVLRR